MLARKITFISMLLVAIFMFMCLVACNNVERFLLNEDGESYSFISAQGLVGNFEIPSYHNGKPVTIIAEEAFSESQTLRSVVIPDTVTHIGKRAFYGCQNLESVVISQNVQVIGNGAFANCNFLSKSNFSINIPASVRIIDDCAFSFAYIDIMFEENSQLEKIGAKAFEGSTILSVNLPHCLKVMHLSAFRATELTELYIPSSTQLIYDTESDKNGLAFTPTLKNIFVGEGNSTCMSKNGVLFTVDGRELLAYPMGREDTEYVIPEGTERVHQSVMLFYNGSLNSVAFPSTFKELHLVSFIIKGKTSVSVKFYSETPPVIYTVTNEQIDFKMIDFYVPIESLDTYKNADGWKDFADRIFPIAE